MGPDDFGIDDLAASFQRNAQLKATHQLSQQVARLAENDSRRQRLPQCPYCGGRLEGQFELCQHCRSPVLWVRGLPCKPGQEDQLEAKHQQYQESLDLKRRKEQRCREYVDEYVGHWRVSYPVIGVMLAIMLIAVAVYAGFSAILVFDGGNKATYQHAAFWVMCFVVTDLLAIAVWTGPQIYRGYRIRTARVAFDEILRMEQLKAQSRNDLSVRDDSKDMEKGPYGY